MVVVVVVVVVVLVVVVVVVVVVVLLLLLLLLLLDRGVAFRAMKRVGELFLVFRAHVFRAMPYALCLC